MALADLMKRGFLTAATATPATAATDETKTGSSAATVAGVAVANGKGAGTTPQCVATVAVVAPMAWDSNLAHPEHWRDALVLEFMAVDGLSRADAEAMAAISVQPRTPAYWMALIAELDLLIDCYCTSAHVSEEAKNRMLAASHSQSLASIPNTIAWFKNELRELTPQLKSKAQDD